MQGQVDWGPVREGRDGGERCNVWRTGESVVQGVCAWVVPSGADRCALATAALPSALWSHAAAIDSCLHLPHTTLAPGP